MVVHLPNEERFWSKVRKTNACWLWTGGLDKDGYGKFQITLTKPHGAKHTPQRHVRAHRYAFKLVQGREPSGNLLHECDVKACVRVDDRHAHEGGQRRNVRDALRRRRSRRCTTPQVVRDIRREVTIGRGVMKRIRLAAKRYGLSEISVQWIVYRVTWKWVD
jgi:hypothetical protein